jgi:hypothetical protein
MALKPLRFLSALSLLLLLFTILLPAGKVQALGNDFPATSLPPLDRFVDELKNDQADELRGIYIPEILAARVVQQPEGDNGFVSPIQNIVTQFVLASRVGSIGLLAHSYLAGESFFLLTEDQKIYLIYGDGQVSTFIVKEMLRYQALDPTSVTSTFRDLENGNLLTARELFTDVYDRSGQVILQTCISTDTSPSWGRLFVIAEPYSP